MTIKQLSGIVSSIGLTKSRKIEYSITITNWYSFKIYLKFWARHESRDQLKIWGKETLNVNLDNAMDILKQTIESNYNRWYSKEWILDFFRYLKTEIPNVIEPVFIQKWNLESKISHKENNINNSETIIFKTNKKISKKNKKIQWWSKSKFWILIFPKRISKLDSNLKLLTENLNLENITKDTNSKELVILKFEYSNLDKNNIKQSNFTQHIEKINQDLTYELVSEFLKNYDNKNKIKGIYVIFNSSKNKYYVGQTKDIQKRICTQHFDYKTGQCINDNFANDFNNGDTFYVYIKEVETKDALDEQEKYYINVFDSFNNGYNKTGGNL